MGHASDCATNNAPALPVGPCDCCADLLEALRYLVGECDPEMDADYNPHAAPLARARAAIQKATQS